MAPIQMILHLSILDNQDNREAQKVQEVVKTKEKEKVINKYKNKNKNKKR